jgi:hypothetical protein
MDARDLSEFIIPWRADSRRTGKPIEPVVRRMSGWGQTEKDRHRCSTAGQPPTTEMFADRPAQPISAITGHLSPKPARSITQEIASRIRKAIIMLATFVCGLQRLACLAFRRLRSFIVSSGSIRGIDRRERDPEIVN